MTYNNIKNIILTVLFGFMALTSCIDDDFSLSGGEDYDIPEGIKEGYSINLVVTLDKMGGTRAASSYNPLELEEIENYIDPEKFRVLFFDHNDKFLFESKSRWVKKLDPGSIHSEWLVSIPVFTYGNDVFDYEYEDDNGDVVEVKGDEWDWETIRKALTTNSFKIAILANRPELDYYPKLSGIEIGAHWYDNKGPYWYPKDTGKKDVFDLHHCQYDPMYHGKSATDLNKEESEKFSGLGIGFYDFIMDDWKKVNDKDADYYAMRPKMGATASWVEHVKRKLLPEDSPYDMRKGKDDKGVVVDRDYPYAILPSYEHPIPMYGIQKFDPITNWTKGTPFNVSDLAGSGADEYHFNTISLLRSVVRLDLLIPKASYPTRPNLVGLWYPNVYSRCEPMDVWTPTDDIWEDDHENDCEWNDIMNYGLTVSKYNTKIGGTNAKPDGTIRNADNKFDFQNTISWFYGAWKEKDWKFLNSEGQDLTPIDNPEGLSYPKIFNPCVQRNKFVISSICTEPEIPDAGIQGDVTHLYNDGYWHFVMYTGERNMIAVNRIPLQGAQTSYTVTWMFKDVDRDQYFCIPIADYSKPQQYATECFGPYKDEDWDGSSNLPKVSKVDARKATTKIINYANTLRDNVTTRDEMPWPLLRNHIYRITVTGPSPDKLTEPHTWDFTQYPDAKTVFNLNTDTKWAYPVAGNQDAILSGDNLSESGGTVYKWSNGYSITKESGTANTENNKTINSHKALKTKPGAKNTLQLPAGVTASEMTIYSYNNGNAGPESKPIDFPNSTDGIEIHTTINTDTGNPTSITLTNNNKEYLFSNSYVGASTGTNLELKNVKEEERGFKKGDIITITARIGSAKDGSMDLFTAESHDSPDYEVVHKFSVANTTSPTPQTYILEDDYDVLYLGRNVGTAAYVSLIKVERPVTTYWSEVAGNEYDENQYPLTHTENTLLDQYKFTFDKPLNEITFTNQGEQCCYIIELKVENANGYWQLSKPNGEIKANGKYVPSLQGLKFESTGSISIYDTDPSKIRLSTNNATITFPEIKPGLIVSITGQSPNATATNRGIAPANNNLEFYSGPRSNNDECIFYGANVVPEEHKAQVEGTNIYTFKWKVKGDPETTVPVSFNIINGGIDFYEFSIEEDPNDPNGISNAPSRASVNSEPSIMIKSEDLHSKSLKFSSR